MHIWSRFCKSIYRWLVLQVVLPLAEILGSVGLVKKTISTIIMVFYSVISSRRTLNLNLMLYVPICQSWIINKLLLICIQNHKHLNKIAQKYVFVIGKWLNLFFVVQLSLVGISASESVTSTISQQQTNGSGRSTFSSLLSKVLYMHTYMHTWNTSLCILCVSLCSMVNDVNVYLCMCMFACLYTLMLQYRPSATLHSHNYALLNNSVKSGLGICFNHASSPSDWRCE